MPIRPSKPMIRACFLNPRARPSCFPAACAAPEIPRWVRPREWGSTKLRRQYLCPPRNAGKLRQSNGFRQRLRPGNVELGFMWRVLSQDDNGIDVATFPLDELPSGSARRGLAATRPAISCPCGCRMTLARGRSTAAAVAGSNTIEAAATGGSPACSSSASWPHICIWAATGAQHFPSARRPQRQRLQPFIWRYTARSEGGGPAPCGALPPTTRTGGKPTIS